MLEREAGIGAVEAITGEAAFTTCRVVRPSTGVEPSGGTGAGVTTETAGADTARTIGNFSSGTAVGIFKAVGTRGTVGVGVIV